MNHRRCDVVVVGAGPVGLLFAAGLAGAAGEVAIHVIDGRDAGRWQESSVDPRVYALSRASEWLLGPLWREVARRRVSSYGRVRVWEGDSPDGPCSLTFDAAEIGEPDLGHIVEDNLLRSVLLDALAETDVPVRLGVGVREIDRHERYSTVSLDDGTRLRADLVVGADGVRSRVRQAFGMRSIDYDYGQSAVVAHVASEKSHEQTAWQRFLVDGPLAFLPLSDGRSSIVWSQGAPAARRVAQLSDGEFVAELESASGRFLGRLTAPGERHLFPLTFMHATRYAGPGVALIGDAAHAVHPLAGQGMNLGLGDAAALVETLTAALARGEHAGDEIVLRRYQRARKAHNLQMQLAFDRLNALFSRPRTPWVGALRGLGLDVVDRLSPVKRLLMHRALGLDRVPRGQTPRSPAADREA